LLNWKVYYRSHFEKEELGVNMDVRDLVRYNHLVRRLYFETLAKLPWSEIIKDRGASFGCMRDMFLHLTLVEDRWINYTIPGRFKEWVNPVCEGFKSFNDLRKYMIAVEEKTEEYLKKTTSEELRQEIVVPWGDTPETKVTTETALAHMVVEDLIHIGELSDLLWQMGVEPPYLAFWRYMHQIDSISRTR
jgi:uncharacterized damage-inducible protein DinB